MTSQLDERELLLGVCGGIAAYKVAALVSQLAQQGAKVQVVLTPGGEKFVGRATFEALSGRKVCTQVFDEPGYPLGPHIELAARADLLCIAPATANVLAKAAQGIADDLLSTLFLAFSGPVLFAPAMNSTMWEQPAVQRNVAQLKEDGHQFIGPSEGWLSCRVQGAGRMAEPDEIFQAVSSLLASDGESPLS